MTPEEAAKATASSTEAQRLSAHEIFEVVVETGRDELNRPMAGLALSALAGGITIGISALAMALLSSILGEGRWVRLLESAVYPIGFIAVIIGRAQFFTENTLFPVITYLAERRHGWRVLYFWAVVLLGNLIGTWLFALLAMKSEALDAVTRSNLAGLGLQAAAHNWLAIFWSAVIGGWLMALVAWMVSASQWTSGQILVTWVLTFIIALGNFTHCVASSAEILSAVVGGQLGVIAYLIWLVPAVAGNLGGGVVIVSLLNYGQVKAGEL